METATSYCPTLETTAGNHVRGFLQKLWKLLRRFQLYAPMTIESPKNTVMRSKDRTRALTVENKSYVLRVKFNDEWLRCYYWDKEIAEMMRHLPVDPDYALKWATKASGVPYA